MSLPVFQTILIAEDSTDTRVMLKRAFELKGYSVLEAADGLEALNLARKECPNLMLVDLNMPGLDGLETIRRIREFKGKWGTIPIVAITAFDVYGMKEAALEMGGDCYVTKPIDLNNLDKVLSSLGFIV
jgi:CheY-like chemotaxis protein